MIQIFFADSDKCRASSKLNDLLLHLPKSMHEKALRYRSAQDAFNYALGRLLLKKGLEDLGLDNDLEKITFKENRKPSLEGVFFNISHSDNLVVCAVSPEGELGIDVEKEKPIVLEDMRRSFTKNEWLMITNASKPLEKFFWYWTRKESIIKALGVNLSYLHQIEIDATHEFFIENKRKWFLKDLDFGNDFYGALCSENTMDDENLEMVRIDFQ